MIETQVKFRVTDGAASLDKHELVAWINRWAGERRFKVQDVSFNDRLTGPDHRLFYATDEFSLEMDRYIPKRTPTVSKIIDDLCKEAKVPEQKVVTKQMFRVTWNSQNMMEQTDDQGVAIRKFNELVLIAARLMKHGVHASVQLCVGVEKVVKHV